MRKTFLHLLCFAAMSVAASGTAHAQAIDGYFRVQNAAKAADNAGYVEVRGPFTAQPDQTFAQATTKPGTVMRIYAEPKTVDGKTLYGIKSLRCQGIEVVGEPIQDYFQTMQDILMSTDLNNINEALWTLVRGGFDHGYTSIGRALLQSMIHIVAARLDDVGVSEKEELAKFAERFNHEVADNISLEICLEPTDNGYRLCYDVPNLECVSTWYLKDENKATFEKGFESMRRYMTNKLGNTGEYLQPDEVAEMQAWGYDPTVKHHNYVENVDGKFIYTPYEEIFADHELLFNWLKLNMIKFTDEDRCPKIELMGFYLPNFAKEMKRHALTAQLIGYFPRLCTDQRVYLTDGKNGVFGHLDFTSAEGAVALGDASQWILHPVTEADDAYLCFPYEGSLTTDIADPASTLYYAAVFTDFDMRAVNPDITRLYTLSAETKTSTINDDEYVFYELEEVADAPARTAILVEMTTPEAANHRIVPDYTTILPERPSDPDPLPDGFTVGDDIISNQRAPHRAAQQSPSFHGVLLPTTVSAEGFGNQWNHEYDEAVPVHTFGSRQDNIRALWFNQTATGSQLQANQAYLMMPATSQNGYAVGEPIDNTTTGITGIEVDTEEVDAIYDLNGVKTDRMESGRVYILNGKKVLAL